MSVMNPVTTSIRLTPPRASISTCQASSDLPEKSIRHLGRSAVSGSIRLPWPAERRMACSIMAAACRERQALEQACALRRAPPHTAAMAATRVSSEEGGTPPKSPIARIFANTAWLLGGKGFGALCGLAYLAILTRSLGLKGFGHFALILGTAQALIAIAG